MENEETFRGYLRKLSKDEIEELQVKYEHHMTRSRAGFLERPVKDKLLRIKKFEKYTNTEDMSKYFWEIREHAKSALGDFLILFDTLTESQLKEILSSELPKEILDKIRTNKDTKVHDRVWQSNPRIENMLRALFKDQKPYSMMDKKEWNKTELKEQEDAWKFFMAQAIIQICFEFLRNNSYITTQAHERLVDEVIDMVNSESKNTRIPRFWRKGSWV